MAHCYVIGGGPSLAGFDFGALPDGYRIGANKSAWLAGCDALVTVDRNFHRKFLDRVSTFRDRAFVALPDAPPRRAPEVNYWHLERGEGMSETWGTLRGSNSGFAALNLAVLMGYTEIALLGFDFQWSDSRSHFHDGYAGQNRNADRHLNTWVKAFERAKGTLWTRGVRVTSFVGPQGSRLRVFPTLPLAELT